MDIADGQTTLGCSIRQDRSTFFAYAPSLLRPKVRVSFSLRSERFADTPALKDETLHIRIAGVDAPEMAHFGNPAQPHAQESLDWLRATLLGRRMRCQLLRKDQYNRIVRRLLLYEKKKADTQVAVPYISRMILPKRPLPLLMLQEGMAVVYTSGGAEFGPWGLDKMKAVEAEAKRQKKGLWGLKRFEHPADYKKRMKMVEEGMVGVEQTSKAQSRERRGVVAFLKRYLLP